jgi:hypothetical protein
MRRLLPLSPATVLSIAAPIAIHHELDSGLGSQSWRSGQLSYSQFISSWSGNIGQPPAGNIGSSSVFLGSSLIGKLMLGFKFSLDA